MSQFSELQLPLIHAGKVRELFDLDADRLLMVATDNISAYDFVLTPGIRDKGVILTQMSLWWLEQLRDVVENHVVAADPTEAIGADRAALVKGRALVCEKLDMVPVECVARGYLTGSGWAEYQKTQSVCGVALPAGLHDGSRLPEPIFTPATKAELGEHDENVDFDTMCRTTGRELGEQLRELTLAIYAKAEGIARARGIVLADTKFEFGRRADGTLVLGDEVLTPDSSRFWDAALWEQGRLGSFDKQYLRDWLVRGSGWDRAGDNPPPALPAEVVEATRARYLEAYERLTGSPLAL